MPVDSSSMLAFPKGEHFYLVLKLIGVATGPTGRVCQRRFGRLLLQRWRHKTSPVRRHSSNETAIAEQARCSEPGDAALVCNRESVAPGH